MESFESFARQVPVAWPGPQELFTLYHVESSALAARGIAPNDHDWGMSFVFRFDRDVPPSLIPHFLEIVGAVEGGLQTLRLASNVRLVPYYEIGTDYLVQAKPPYDGGYSVDRFREFIDYGDCMPPSEFPRSWARLVEGFIEGEARIDAASPERTSVLRTVMHRSLVGPRSELFWSDDGEPSFSLYRPNVERGELEAWARSR